MVKIAIVEDAENDRKMLYQYTRDFVKEINEHAEIQCFTDGVRFLNNYPKDLDILLLDIEMPRLSGLDTAKRVRRFDKRVIILFITNMIQFALEGYAVEAMDFVVKPVHYLTFCERMKNAFIRLERDQTRFVEIKSGKETRYIDIKQIVFAETNNKRVLIHMRGGEEISCSEAMQSMEKKLVDYGFFRCHTAFLVNLHYIETTQSNEVIVKGVSIPISKYRKKEFMQVLTNYMGGLI